MKIHLSIILLICVLLALTNCSKESVVINEPEPTVNQPPQSPDIEILKIRYNTVTISCSKAFDPDKDTLYYSLYLEDSLYISNSTIDLFYKFEHLEPETNYQGIVRVSDSINPAVDTEFSFTTSNYVTRFSHTLNSTLGNVGGGISIELTDDGGYIILGTISTLTHYLYVLKVDSLGYEQWSKFYDIKCSAFRGEIIKVSNGNYAFAIQEHIIMIDPSGKIVWHVTKEEYTDYISILENDNHELIIAGENSNMSSLSSYNLAGEEIWIKHYHGVDEVFVRSLCKTHDNNYTIFGATRGVIHDFWIMKIDQNGEMLWEKVYEDPEYAFADQIILCKDNGFVLAGQTHGNTGTSTSRIIKTDMFGNLLWDKSFRWNGFGTDVRSIVQNKDETYIFCADNGDTPSETVLVKLDQSGNLVWKNHFKPELSMDYIWHPSEIKLCPDNGVIVTGIKTWVWNGYEDQERGLWIFKTDEDGYYSIE